MVFMRAGQITLLDDQKNRLVTEAILAFQKYIRISLMKRLLMKGKIIQIYLREQTGTSGNSGSGLMATAQDLYQWWVEERAQASSSKNC
jgi:myosin heavy subunit